MSVIKVQGETYNDLDELDQVIVQLTEQLEQMPSDTPEHTKLAQHVEALRAASVESGNGDDTASPAAESEPAPDEPTKEAENEPYDATHSLRDAADNGKPIICPLCGSDIPFPETPPIDPYAEPCPDCNGWGQVLTGSRVDGHVWRDCKGCNGQGFREKGTASVSVAPTHAALAAEAPGARWDATSETWMPPEGQQPPWAGAVWDSYYGKWS